MRARQPFLAGAISGVAILGSLLPQGAAHWLEPLRQKFPIEELYLNWFIRFKADVLDWVHLTFYADELTVAPKEEPPMPQAQQLGFDSEDEEK